MSGAETVADETRGARLPFTLAIFAGSFLLFLIQPMLARMALPRLGGAPAVWNSAMLVYQMLLLAAYAYAHVLGRWSGRTQVAVHLSLLALAATSLPLSLSAAQPPADGEPLLWVPWLLLGSAGLLFFAIAAQSPLLQRWMVLRGGGDPYPLFVASNVGSLGGLLAYPLVIEPLLGLGRQSWWWSAGFIGMALLVAVAGLPLLRGGPAVRATDRPKALPAGRLIGWALLACVPSGLMLSTTLHLTTDIAPMPLLWAIPLGLYLISFIIGFAERRRAAEVCRKLAPFALIYAVVTLFVVGGPSLPLVALGALLALFLAATAIHARMFDERPDPEQLTAFYLALAAGGALGGLLAALIAPLLFSWTYEHPLLLLAAAWLLGSRQPLAAVRDALAGRNAGRILWLIAALLAVLIPLFWWNEKSQWLAGSGVVAATVATSALGRRALFTLALALSLLAGGGLQRLAESASGGLVRSYFGVYRILEQAGARVIVHGTTTHGVQLLGPADRRRTATSYYWLGSGVGRVMSDLPAITGRGARVGVVGLGAGTLACYARPDERWTFFEIDPVVVRLATSPAFTFLSDCAPKARIVVGDARLRLAETASRSFDVLVVDAFSSDAIPMHLLTREAFAVYRRVLRPGGVLMVHISNRHLELRPVVRTSGESAGMTGVIAAAAGDPLSRGYESSWTALSTDPATIARIAATEQGLWVPLPLGQRVHWSDDHASILPLLRTPW